MVPSKTPKRPRVPDVVPPPAPKKQFVTVVRDVYGRRLEFQEPVQ